MTETQIINKLSDIIIELDARESSSNSVISSLREYGWVELCDKGINLFQDLKQNATAQYNNIKSSDIEIVYNELVKVVKPVIYYSAFKEYIHILPNIVRGSVDMRYHVDIISYNINVLYSESNMLYDEWITDKTLSDCMELLNDKIKEYNNFNIVKYGNDKQGYISIELK